LHTFTFANAVQQALRRLHSSIELLRAVFVAAMSNYLNRFLNVPAVAIPKYTEGNIDSVKNQGAENIMGKFLDALDNRQQVNEAANIVASHLVTGRDEVILPILVHSLLIQDRSFHTIQMLEAALTQKSEAKRLRLFEDDNRASAVL